MRTRLGCGLLLPTNFGPLLRLTRYPRVICEQMRYRSDMCRFWLVFLILATLPVISFAQFTPQMTGQINSQTSTTSSAPDTTTAPPASSSANSGSISLAAVSAPAGYQLSSNDAIAVEVFGEEDLKATARLNSEGNVSLPLIGAIHLGGLTVTQATARVTELYARDYLVSPKVNVTLLGYARRRFTVLGQVNRPGSFEMPETSPGGIDLLEAIAMAGGYTRIAAPERVVVRRHSGNKDEMLKVNAKRVERGQAVNFLVLPGDSITVGESIF
jgi:protein involved in polysaccharide export with SLBB domain